MEKGETAGSEEFLQDTFQARTALQRWAPGLKATAKNESVSMHET